MQVNYSAESNYYDAESITKSFCLYSVLFQYQYIACVYERECVSMYMHLYAQRYECKTIFL